MKLINFNLKYTLYQFTYLLRSLEQIRAIGIKVALRRTFQNILLYLVKSIYFETTETFTYLYAMWKSLYHHHTSRSFFAFKE